MDVVFLKSVWLYLPDGNKERIISQTGDDKGIGFDSLQAGVERRHYFKYNDYSITKTKRGDYVVLPVDDEYENEVTHPSHYATLTPEPIAFIRDKDYLTGNALKYIFRAGHKGGADENVDMGKAAWYLRELVNEQGDQTAIAILRGVYWDTIDRQLAPEDRARRFGTGSQSLCLLFHTITSVTTFLSVSIVENIVEIAFVDLVKCGELWGAAAFMQATDCNFTIRSDATDPSTTIRALMYTVQRVQGVTLALRSWQEGRIAFIRCTYSDEIDGYVLTYSDSSNDNAYVCAIMLSERSEKVIGIIPGEKPALTFEAEAILRDKGYTVHIIEENEDWRLAQWLH